MVACFHCRIQKLSCSSNSPTCRQCHLASLECKYGRPNRNNFATQDKGRRKRKRLSSAAYPNQGPKTDRSDSEDTATEAGDSPLCHPDHCLPPSVQERKRKRLSSTAHSSKRSKTDQSNSEDTATEAGDCPFWYLDHCLSPSAQDSDGGSIYPSIEMTLEESQTAQRDPIFAPRNAVIYLQREGRPIYTSLGLSRSSFVSMKRETRNVTFYEFILEK